MSYYVGIDLGGTTIKGGIVNENNEILAQKSVKTLSERGFIPVAEDIAQLVRDLSAMVDSEVEALTAIGIGSPGAIDSKQGEVLFAGNLNWERQPLAAEVSRLLDKKVVVGNDANCAALGEYLLTGEKFDSMVMITIGTGVGFGFVTDGKVYSGATYGGGEYGHTSLVFDGEACTCGQKGCIEAYASFTALLRDTNRFIQANPKSYLSYIKRQTGEIDGAKIFKAAIEGDQDAVRIVDRFLSYIGQAVVNLVNTLDPAAIIIGGGISKSAEYFLPRVRAYAKEHAFCKVVASAEILVASAGNDVGIIGAAKLFEHM